MVREEGKSISSRILDEAPGSPFFDPDGEK
jgi:hypothetical protein